MALVVVGTDTDVGKTLVSAVVLARYGAQVPGLTYFKPIATGGPQGDAAWLATHLPAAVTGGDGGRSSQSSVPTPVTVLPSWRCYEPPVSPHLAARWVGDTIGEAALCAAIDTQAQQVQARGGALLVEGIGGVHVPLCDSGLLWSDVMTRFAECDAKVLLVARSAVGTLNHTLLTLEALQRRGVEVAALVLSGPANPNNEQDLLRFGKVPLLLRLDQVEAITPEGIAAAAAGFDPDGHLLPMLQAPWRCAAEVVAATSL